MQIHVCEPPGDILVFLTGEEEIEDACKKIGKEIQQMGEQASLATNMMSHSYQPFMSTVTVLCIPSVCKLTVFLVVPIDGALGCVSFTRLACRSHLATCKSGTRCRCEPVYYA